MVSIIYFPFRAILPWVIVTVVIAVLAVARWDMVMENDDPISGKIICGYPTVSQIILEKSKAHNSLSYVSAKQK